MVENVAIIIAVLISVLFLWFFWVRLPAQMARRRGRDPLGWVLLFWALSPLWGVIILLIAGDRRS